jgi:NAD(P)H-flavin reductase/ferredoxin
MPVISIANVAHAPIEANGRCILDAALDAGVSFPHACSAGECGSCKSQLLSGDVVHDRHDEQALTRNERADGLILACRARPVGDVQVRWLARDNPLPVARMKARIAELRRAASDVIVVALELDGGARFVFRPGQFAKLHFDRLPPRSYSMASQPDERRVEFHVRVLPQGAVGQHLASRAQPGDAVVLDGPHGDAYWHGPTTDRLLLLGGGTGLAPILSILDAALRDGQDAQRIVVYHGVRTAADLYAHEALLQRSRASGFSYRPVLAQEAAASMRRGHLHEALACENGRFEATQVYVCGPPPMVDAVRTLARERGAPECCIHADAFHPAPAAEQSTWRGWWRRRNERRSQLS